MVKTIPQIGSRWSNLEAVAEPHPAGRCSSAGPSSSCHPGPVAPEKLRAALNGNHGSRWIKIPFFSNISQLSDISCETSIQYICIYIYILIYIYICMYMYMYIYIIYICIYLSQSVSMKWLRLISRYLVGINTNRKCPWTTGCEFGIDRWTWTSPILCQVILAGIIRYAPSILSYQYGQDQLATLQIPLPAY